jgi:hypothetical protein
MSTLRLGWDFQTSANFFKSAHALYSCNTFMPHKKFPRTPQNQVLVAQAQGPPTPILRGN